MLGALAENRKHDCGSLREGPKTTRFSQREATTSIVAAAAIQTPLLGVEFSVEQAAARLQVEALDKLAAHHRGPLALGRDHRVDARAHTWGVAAALLDDNGVVVERQRSVQPADAEPSVSALNDPAEAAEAGGEGQPLAAGIESADCVIPAGIP